MATDGSAGWPAAPGDDIAQIATPALVIDLDAFDRNIARMRDLCAARGLRLRAHAKTHKSADIARIQMAAGGAVGVCCQKVSEAWALAEAGVDDILISNEISGPRRAAMVADLARRIRISVCVDSVAGVAELSAAAEAAAVEIPVLVEVDIGAGRCGVAPGAAAVDLARSVAGAAGLRFDGVQVYHGGAQHVADPAARRAVLAAAADKVRLTLDALGAGGFSCRTIGGSGTGSLLIESGFAQINEVQCGSYIFMDADYDRIAEFDGSRPGGMENALFVLTEVMSDATPGRPVCDAGLKAHSVDSGLPRVVTPGVSYTEASDEHGTLDDPGHVLARGDRLRLVPGHCDPTCNLHDWYVGLRGTKVEAIWPVTARGKLF